MFRDLFQISHFAKVEMERIEKKGNHHYQAYSVSTVLSIQVSLVAHYGSVSIDSGSDWMAK